MFLLCIIEENAPSGGVLARFYRPGGGEFAHQKNCPGFGRGGDGQAWN